MRAALLNKIKELLHQKRSNPLLIVIDGPAGAGKTTLAREILSCLHVGEVIHGDDLYNGWSDALTDTLELNIKAWVLQPLRAGMLPRYQRYDWDLGEYRSEVVVPKTPLIILEGVGVALPAVTTYADLSIWIDIDPDFGLERVIARDGGAIADEMRQWILVQERFFALHRNRENCSLHLPYGAPALP
jgi:uridine kinase